jgi:hypothetical protein
VTPVHDPGIDVRMFRTVFLHRWVQPRRTMPASQGFRTRQAGGIARVAEGQLCRVTTSANA